MLLVLVAIAIGAWLLGRESSLQRIVAEAEKRLEGQLTVQGVRGSIYDRVEFDRLVFRSKTQVITVEHGSLRYGLEPFARRFTIEDARAQRVVIETLAKSTDPTGEPDTLVLPDALRVDTLRIDHLHLDAIDLVAAGKTTRLTDADLKGRYAFEAGAKRWIVERLAIASPWGKASGHASLAATRPFAIDGRLVLDGATPDLPGVTLHAPIVIGGRLGELALASDFTLSDPGAKSLPGHAEAKVLPFRDQPIDHAVLHVAGIDPKRWKDALPHADLAIDADVTPLASPPAGAEGTDPFRGRVRIVNAAPGSIDRDRIPVASLRADVDGDSAAIAFTDLVADLGAAGQLAGKGRYRFADGGTPSFEGTVRALDLRAIHVKLIASKFAGPIAVSRRAGIVHVDTDLGDAGRGVRLRGEIERQQIRIADAKLVLGASRLAFTGRIDLDRDRPFEAKGEVAHLNPHDFGDFAKADLNGAFTASGTLGMDATAREPQRLRVMADLRIDPSRVVDRPLAGTARATVSGALARDGGFALNDIANAKIALAVGANRVDADGDFGRPQDQLRWTVDAPKTAELGLGLSGSIKGHGVLGGTVAEPALEFDVAGDDLRYGQAKAVATTATATTAAKAATASFGLKSLRAHGSLLAGSKGRLDADIALVELREGGNAQPLLQSADAHVKGTRDDHAVTLAAKSDRFDITGAAHGALDGGFAWRGMVDKLESRGRVPFSIETPAALLASRDRIEVGATRLRFDEGRLDLDRLTYVDGKLATAGKASGFPLALVGTFSRDFARQVSTSLKFGGEWDLRINNAGDTIDGTLKIARESGNVQFLTEPRFSVDPERIELNATIVANRISAQIAATGRGLGKIDASFDTRLSKRDGQWGIAGDAPLELRSDIDIPDLRWLARLSGRPGLDLSGRLQVAVNGKGTVAQPLLAGHASGESVGLRWPDQGINFHDGRFDMDFEGDRLLLKSADVASGGGHLSASGDLRLANRAVSGSLAVKADKFEAISRTDRTVVVSGNGSARFGPKGIDVTADLKADRGSLQLAERRGPTLSDDIVIVGRETTDQDVPAQSVPVRFEVKFDMGDDFKVKGSGFDGKLGGVIRITGTGGEMRAIGAVTVREGTYEAYGQRLTIDRGNLVFSGPIDNPALDILAVRKNLAVEAGVQISGTALAPVARLTSTPSVPDTEKLSWLVLGHGLSASSKGDFGILTTAAASLLGSSDSASIQSRIAATLGVDEIGVSGLGGSQGGLLTVGKQISSRLRVSFEQGFTKAATLLKIRYNIYQRVDLQVQTGTESAVDIFYTFSFD